MKALKDRIAAAHGLLLATPEYNNSIPRPFKNAIDWLSRPAADIPRVFGGKPVALMGAGKSFDAEGRLTDEALRGLLAKFMQEFAGFVGG